jgi:hypothetical protein
MNKKKTVSLCITVLALLFSVFGTVYAQVDDNQQYQSIIVSTPTVEPTVTGTSVVNYSHPIIKLLDAYFGALFGTPIPTSTETPVPGETPVVTETPVPGETPVVTETPVPGETPVVTETPVPTEDTGLTDVGEQIAGYHADGMGFGVLVKLYSIAAESKAACASSSAAAVEPTACVPVTVEELITAFKSGEGIGELMKEYGRPSMLGVGHVRKALKQAQNQDIEKGQQNDHGNNPDKNNGKKK